LDGFRKKSDNLYDRVRAILFLYAGYRFFLMESPDTPATGKIPYEGFEDLLARRFETAISRFLERVERDGPNASLFSGLAEAYHHLSFQILADQVRRSVRSSRGNQWMFRVGHLEDHPIRIHPKLLRRAGGTAFTRYSKKTPPCAWTSRTAAGRTSFSWAWTTPRGPA
jgi:hypothetical protein